MVVNTQHFYNRPQVSVMNGYVEIDGNVQTQPQVSESRVTYQEVSVPELREPLLESIKQESRV